MAQKNRDYWEERQVKREAKAFTTIQDIEKEYKIALEKAKQDINKEISRITTTYMKDNNLSYHEALKLLKGDEYKVWKKDLHDYMKEYNKLLKTAPLEAKKLYLEIETLSARSRMSHLDSLRAQVDMEMVKLIFGVEDSAKNALTSVYRDTFLEVTKDFGINTIVSRDKIKTVLDRPWSGANFSERLWSNTDKLAQTVKQEIVNGMIQGINLQTMTKRVSERFETAKKNDVERLLRTEVNYVLNQATLDGYKEAGIEKYEFSATLDSRTSQICSELHGEVFEIKKIAVGLNYPPMHPRCRSTTIPVIDYESLAKQGREEVEKNNYILDEDNKELLTNNENKSITKEKDNFEKAIDKVLEHGNKTGAEALMWLDLNGNEIVPFATGDKNSVSIPRETILFLSKQSESTVISLHNHPSSSSFSPEDMNVACILSSVKEMRVVGHDGTRYYLEIGAGERKSLKVIRKTYDEIGRDFESEYWKLCSDLGDNKKAWKEVSHMINESLAKKFGWKYRRENNE